MYIDANGRLTIRLSDEELDNITIQHLQKNAKMCIDLTRIELTQLAKKDLPANLYAMIVENIHNHERNFHALNAAIEFFGGDQIYTHEDTFKVEVHDETTDGGA